MDQARTQQARRFDASAIHDRSTPGSFQRLRPGSSPGNSAQYQTLAELAAAVTHQTRLDADSHLFWRDEPFAALFFVISGTIKTYNVDIEGQERVRGFHFPGELVGMDGIADGTHRCHAVALGTTLVHRLPFEHIVGLTTRVPAIQTELFRCMSREFGAAMSLAGNYTAEQRVAGFLLEMLRRSPTSVGGKSITLTMPRRDIANHLRMATETVSRTLTRFHYTGVIRAQGRYIEFCDIAGLRQIAEPTFSN